MAKKIGAVLQLFVADSSETLRHNTSRVMSNSLMCTLQFCVKLWRLSQGRWDRHIARFWNTFIGKLPVMRQALGDLYIYIRIMLIRIFEI